MSFPSRSTIRALPVQILGAGRCLPAERLSSADLERELGLEEGWIVRTTGVHERRRAGEESAVTMATRAARHALDAARCGPREIDLIVGASSAPHQAIPCTAALVQRALGECDGMSACFDVNSTCLSFLNALQVVAHLVAAGVHERALVFSSELTRHSLNPREPESATLLGDGAAAVVVGASPSGSASAIVGSRFVTHSSGAELTVCRGGGTAHHPNAASTTPEMNLFHMDGPGVYRMATRLLAPWLAGFLASIEWEPGRIDAVVPHQASGRGVDLLTRQMQFRADQVVRNLETHGNCVAAALPLALAEAIENGRIERGQHVLLVGTGAGLSLGAVALVF